MRTWLVTLLMAVLLCGCVHRLPLSRVKDVNQRVVALAGPTNRDIAIIFSTARGRNAEMAGATGGLIGAFTGRAVAAAGEGGGTDLVEQLRRNQTRDEPHAIENAIKGRLDKTGIRTSGFAADHQLFLRVRAVGLIEPQRNFWVPAASLSARLERLTDKQVIWSAQVFSTGTHLRSLDEFRNQPELYEKDFAEVAEDLARQLVEGPIRN